VAGRAAAFAGVVLAATSASFAVATPASAHGVDSVPATSERARVLGVEPEVDGLQVRIVDAGRRVELRNDSGADVVVLGYDGEPYLRVGPGGAWRNRYSPATFWNARADTVGRLPDAFDAARAPEWDRLGDAPVVRWHDHRLHWQGAAPDVDAPRRVLATWTVALRRGGHEIVVRGDILHEPPPAPLVPAALAVGVALALVAAGRTRRWPAALAGSLGAVATLGVVDAVGRWGASSRSAPTKLLESVYVLGGAALALWAVARLARRGADPFATTPLALLAGVVTTIALALAALPWLRASFLPTTLPDALARVLVGVALGAGVAAVVVAATRLRPPVRDAHPAQGA
jgi:hypothetical protein